MRRKSLLKKKLKYIEVVHQLFIDINEVCDSVKREILYNILIEFGIFIKREELIKTCLNESYSRVWVGKHLSDMFSVKNALKQGDAISLLFFNFASDCAMRRVQVNRYGLKLNDAQQLLVYSDYINIFGGNVRTPNKNTTALLVGSNEIGLEVNADKTKYMVMSRVQNTGRSHSIKTDNNFFERVDELKYV
jgi:hypothetical protein